MKGVGATSTWICWCLMMLIVVMTSVATTNISEIEIEASKPKKDNYPIVEYQIEAGGGKSYNEFITKLRKTVEATKTCNIPITTKNPSKKYVLVKITSTDGKKSVTLGIMASDLYVLGYQNGERNNKNRYRATLLKGVKDDKLFEDSDKKNTYYDGSYEGLEGAAKPTNRLNIVLTFDKLNKDVVALSPITTKYTEQNQAEFFLRVTQMVSEAARFKFIQEQISKNLQIPDKNFRDKLIAYESEWGKISQAIHEASPACAKLKNSITIDGKKISEVDQFRDDVGLLKFKK